MNKLPRMCNGMNSMDGVNRRRVVSGARRWIAMNAYYIHVRYYLLARGLFRVEELIH